MTSKEFGRQLSELVDATEINLKKIESFAASFCCDWFSRPRSSILTSGKDSASPLLPEGPFSRSKEVK